MATLTPRRLRVGSSASYLGSVADGELTCPEAITRTLTNALAANDYSDCVKDLHGLGIDPQSYIDGLDEAIDILSPESDIHERCVRALSKACGIHRLLPNSHKLKSTLKTSQHPVASGGFSDVWKAENETGEVFAIKVLRMYQNNTEEVKKKYCREVIISKRTSHPNVLRIEGVAPDLFPCCMVSRWMDNGNMLEYLNQCREPVDHMGLLLGIICGLNYLHTHKVVHGDLKGYNIFIDALGHPRLADFGLSSVAENIYSAGSSKLAGGGSIRWFAPELVDPAAGQRETWIKHTTQSDIYSLAMVIIEVFTGKIPFPDSTSAHVVVLTSKGGRPSKPPGSEFFGLGPAVWKLTEECWSQNPGKRPDIASVFRRFQAIVDAGGREQASLPRRILEWVSGNETAQHRINKLDQELEKGLIPDDDIPVKLNELCKLCGSNRLIPESMKLQDDGKDPLEATKYTSQFMTFQSEFKGRKVAVKIVRLYVSQKLDEPLSRFCKEAVTWKHLRHPNILPLLGATLREHRLCLLSEWMDQGNINEYLKLREHREVNRIELLVEAIDGLSYMHGLQVVHGNLKGANIFIRDFHVCIADFGISTIARIEPCSSISRASTVSLVSFTSGGSLPWMSPELLDPKRFNVSDPRPTKKSDLYALGMVIYEVLCGHAPYDGLDREEINDAILTGIRPSKPKAAAHLGLLDKLWKVLQRCWDEERGARPDLRAIRDCLDDLVPVWHVRTHLPLTTADNTALSYTKSYPSSSSTPASPSSPLPSS